MSLVRVRSLALESDYSDDPRVPTLQTLCTKLTTVDSDNLEQLGIDIATQLSESEKDIITKLRNDGPLTEEHLSSKTALEFLCSLGLCSLGVSKGNDGAYYCTQYGHWVYKGMQQLTENPELANPGDDGVLGNLAPDTEEA